MSKEGQQGDGTFTDITHKLICYDMVILGMDQGLYKDCKLTKPCIRPSRNIFLVLQ